MITERFSLSGDDNHNIAGVRWLPKHGPVPTAVLQIVHGMAEHIDRYTDFAQFCVKNGIAVYGHDHRGHGKSASEDNPPGHFADKDGWNRVLSDIQKVREKAQNDFPGEPYFIMGHSMGSFLTRHYLSLHSEGISGAVISGTGHTPSFMAGLLGVISGMQILFKGPRRKSRLCDGLSFSSYNKYFSPGETGREWLTRDKEIVKAYVDDPACGFICTAGFYRDLAEGLRFIASKKAYRSVPDSLPLLFVSGDSDPVGNMGKGVAVVTERFRKITGTHDLTLYMNRGGRHENLNETNRTEIYELILNWIKDHTPAKQEA